MLYDAWGRPVDVAHLSHELIMVGAEPVAPTQTREIVRSRSFKLNLGDYQSMDFFCSQKAQCPAHMTDEVSNDLDEWCYEEVMKSVKEVKAAKAAKEAKTKGRAA